ncbi:hypothetical protein HS088_TW11G00967 [Tripterygium wilfordii]|uniref:GDSL esterase/lipase n=1 Tax=Tripterygium wilfordii TaxID=458696 RepID=A0A7J7D3G0_TRIWF|nr:hypothetical protein HS088_TW11G00967 [Tripterygium wilfordii]
MQDRQLGGGCNVYANYAAQLFNDKLKSALQNLNSHLPGAKFVYVDIYSALDNISQNPQNFGFEVVDNGCCMTIGPVCNSMNPYMPRSYKVYILG